MALAINTSRISPNRSVRRSKIRRIVIHHWDDPKRKPSLAGVVSWLTSTRSRVSAHYVVSERQVYRLVPESVVAWHAAGGNSDSIGIELDPRQQDSTYETAAALIRDIRSRHGDIPLVRHRDVKGSYTSCPGTYDLARLDRLARGQSAKPAPTKAPPFPLPRKPGALYFYGLGKEMTAVTGTMRNRDVPHDVVQVNGRWKSKGLAQFQTRLIERGWTELKKDGPDGRFGSRMHKVVGQFQKAMGLKVDHKIGPGTWAAAWTEPVT